MGKKQILKASLKQYGSSKEIYGISLNTDNSLLLLEDGKLLDIGKQSVSDIRISADKAGMSLTPHSVEASASATRNVNPQIRTILENGYDAFLAAAKIQDKVNKLLEEMKPLEAPIASMATDVRQAKGLLSTREFTDAFVKALSPEVQKAMRSTVRNYHGNCDSFMAYLSAKELELRLDIDIKKYFRESDFTYQEYDGTIFLRDDCEKSKQYQSILSKYSTHLPVKAKFDEGLEVGGDKDFLHYYCAYTVRIEKPLTEEYAKKLAADFCNGKSRSKNNIER